MAAEVYEVLKSSRGISEVENELVRLLDVPNFALIKRLITHRLKIVWCMKLARAQDDDERAEIETEMAQEPDTLAILQALQTTRASKRERQELKERTIR